MTQARQAMPVKKRNQLRRGDLIIYPFLWSWENQRGQISAYRMRPCMVISRIRMDDGDRVAILPITTKEARPGKRSIPIPESECLRTGMSTKFQSYVCLSDMNSDRVDKPSFIRGHVPCRAFSPEFTEQIRQEFQECVKNGISDHIQRKAKAERDVEMDFQI